MCLDLTVITLSIDRKTLGTIFPSSWYFRNNTQIYHIHSLIISTFKGSDQIAWEIFRISFHISEIAFHISAIIVSISVPSFIHGGVSAWARSHWLSIRIPVSVIIIETRLHVVTIRALVTSLKTIWLPRFMVSMNISMLIQIIINLGVWYTYPKYLSTIEPFELSRVSPRALLSHA